MKTSTMSTATAVVRKRMTQAERSEATRESLLASAMTVFAERGYHAASLEQVAESAGYSKGAVYAQFESKADLFLALLERRIQARIENTRADAVSSKTFIEFANAFVNRLVRSFREEPDWWLLVLEFRTYVIRHPALLERYRQVHDANVNSAAQSLAQNLRDRGFEPKVSVEEVARCCIAAANGCVLERLGEPSTMTDKLMMRVNLSVLREFLPEAMQLTSPPKKTVSGKGRIRPSRKPNS